MALTHRITRRIDLAREPGQWVEVRMPSMAIKEAAREARMKRAIAMVEGMDLGRLRSLQADQKQEDGPEYDWRTILVGCITAWSYEDPASAANIAELDEHTVSVLMAELLPKAESGDPKAA